MGIDTMNGRRAVFLDRDGVLNRALCDGGSSFPPPDAESMEIMPGAGESVAALRAAGYLCICVTNQPDIARGTRTMENVASMNEKVTGVLDLDDLYLCPHDNADGCDCRKPKPGMLLAAIAKWGIDPDASWMVGDRLTDVEAGRAAGCRTILICETSPPPGPDHVSRDLPEAVEYIMRAGKTRAAEPGGR